MSRYRNNILGTIRRGQVLRNHGPGAIIDFKLDKSGSVSVIARSLDNWPRSFEKPRSTERISEERLQNKLGKEYFRLVPIIVSEDSDDVENLELNKYKRLSGYRFPRWLQCTNCNEIKFYTKFFSEEGDASRRCLKCEDKLKDNVYAIPTRFITCCTAGHIAEFPWKYFYEKQIIHKKDKKYECFKPGKMRLKIVQEGTLGLSGLKLICLNCMSQKSLEGIFDKDTLKQYGFKCLGFNIWLGEKDKNDCPNIPRVLLRGASNTYFAKQESALTIPPLNDDFNQWVYDELNFNLKIFEGRSYDEIQKILKMFEDKIEKQFGSFENGVKQIINRYEYIKNPKRRNLKYEEYKRFLNPEKHDYDFDSVGEQKDFEIRDMKIPSSISNYVDKIVQVMKLREVMVLTGFTRIYPPDDGRSTVARIIRSDAQDKINWLPASEVRGEGIFLTLNQDKINEWEKQNNIVERANLISESYIKDWKKRHGLDSVTPIKITPRYLLIHALSHVLIRQLTFDCGYYTSSLRERIYVNEESENMLGLLIYTATSDADGTLGGLSRQAEPDRFNKTFINAITNARWCSSDPLCIKKTANVTEDYNLAGCHSCIMLPETSCEQFNSFLDRSMLIGDSTDGAKGFFSSLVNE